MKVFGPEGSISQRGSIIEVKDVAALEARRQIRDLITYARANSLRIEIFTNAPPPVRGNIADAMVEGIVTLRPIQ
jgi:hypothetical protein